MSCTCRSIWRHCHQMHLHTWEQQWSHRVLDQMCHVCSACLRILHLTLLWVRGACVLVPNPTCQNLTGTCPPTSMCLLVCSNGYVDCYKLQIELEAQNLIDKLFYQPSSQIWYRSSQICLKDSVFLLPYCLWCSSSLWSCKSMREELLGWPTNSQSALAYAL